jgi:hypothetical protein
MVAMVVFVVASLLFFARLHLHNHVLSNYLEDIAGAITVIVLSVATYEKWENRHELGRSRASQNMGIRRVKDEVFQLLYEYAFVLNLRWNPNSEAMRGIDSLVSGSEFSHAATELHAKTAKHISQKEVTIRSTLFATSRQALSDIQLSKQTYGEMDELITQAERSLDRIDMALAIYGYSFTPETHEWALSVRESLSRCIVGKLPILSIHLSSISGSVNSKLRSTDREGISEIVSELVEVGIRADKNE